MPDPMNDSNWSNLDEMAFKEALAMANEARGRVEEHDPQTHQHGVRVAQWATLMAGRLPGFGLRRRRRLEISALLHDYGKLMIPRSVLNKPGPLSDHEWTLVRHHPEVGAMTAPVNPAFLEKSAILWHHKGYDGTGYPSAGPWGLSIPMEARITTVADVFDAITSRRSYREGGGARTPAEALEVLRSLAGTHLDPNLVALFETLYAESAADAGGAAGMQTLAVRWVITSEADQVRRLLERELGPHDRKDPLGGTEPPPGLVERLVARIVRANLDAESARNLVLWVLRQPLKETFRAEDLAMEPAEAAEAVRRAGNHDEAVLYVRPSRARQSYMSLVVFSGFLWLCVGEQAGDRIRISLIR